MNSPLRGTYVLVAHAADSSYLAVGRLGCLRLDTGFLAYVGSALGPGGLRARIARHLDPARSMHWHIDYLKRATRTVEVWYVVDPIRREHAWARALAGLPHASIPMQGFGSSDCNCAAHLVHFPAAPERAAFRDALDRTRGAGKGPVRVFHPTSN